MDPPMNREQLQEHKYAEMVRDLLERIQVANDRIKALELENDDLWDQLNSSSQNSSEQMETIDVDAEHLEIYCQNINRMESDSKIEQIRTKLATRSDAVVILTETSWYDHIDSAKLFQNQYTVFRCDRDRLVLQHGGGVLVAVKRTYQCERLVVDYTDREFQQVWTKVHLSDGQIHVFAAVYFSVKSKKEQYERFFQCAEQIMGGLPSEVKVHIYGDFNQKSIMFRKNPTNRCLLMPDLSVTNSTATFIYIRMLQLGLHQVNHVKNQRGRFLDLLLTNCTRNIKIQEALNPIHEKSEVDHTAIEYFVDI